ARWEWHSRYQRPYRTTTDQGSTSASHSRPASLRYATDTRRPAATASTSSPATTGSGRDEWGSGAAEAYERSSAACRPTLSGSALTTLSRAVPTGSPASAAAGRP